MLHICPESDCSREILPHSFIFPDTFLTFVNKRLQSVFFDLILSVQSQKFLYFQLYRQTVGIPSGLSRNHLPFHGLVSRDHIFDNTGKNMTNMRLSISGRRAVVKGVCLPFLSVFHALFKNLVLFPEFLYFLFPVTEF